MRQARLQGRAQRRRRPPPGTRGAAARPAQRLARRPPARPAVPGRPGRRPPHGHRRGVRRRPHPRRGAPPARPADHPRARAARRGPVPGHDFLDKRGVWHRDIKPDNLALRELDRKGRELVLFDFSLAGTPDTDLIAGTRGYLDPFLGTAAGSATTRPPSCTRSPSPCTRWPAASCRPGATTWPTPVPRPGRGGAARRGPLRPGGPRRPGGVLPGRAAPRRRQAVRLAARHDPGLDRHLPRPGDGPAAHHRVHQRRRRDDETPTRQPTRPSRPRQARRGGREGDRGDPAGRRRPVRRTRCRSRSSSLGVSTAGDLARSPPGGSRRLRGIGTRAPLRAGPPVPRMAPAVQPHRGRPAPPGHPVGRRAEPASVRDQDVASERSRLAPGRSLPAAEPAENPRRSCPSTRWSAAWSRTLPELAQVTGLRAPRTGPRRSSPWAGRRRSPAPPACPRRRWPRTWTGSAAAGQKSVPALTPVRDDLVEILARARPGPGLAAARRRPAGPARLRARRPGRAAAARRDLRPRRRRDRGTPRLGPTASRRLAPAADGRCRRDRCIVALTDTRRGRHRPARRGPVRLRRAARRAGRRARRPGPAARRDRDQAGAARGATPPSTRCACPTPTWSCSPPPRRAKSAATPRLELYPRDLSAPNAQ